MNSPPTSDAIGTDGVALAISIFPDVSGSTLTLQHSTFDELATSIRNVPTYASKAACPLLKLATFGDHRSDANSLRINDNIISVSGVEGDYDGGIVSLAEAQMMVANNNLACIFYTSPSHSQDAPRWRVLCPLSKAHAPAERERFTARLNGALGGILAPESFALSQTYYVGRINGAPYEVAQVNGSCIDLLDELDSIAIGRSFKTIDADGNTVRHSPDESLFADHVLTLKRKLKSGDGRREMLKSYIASKSARHFTSPEILMMARGVSNEYFDPADPIDQANIKQIVDHFIAARDKEKDALDRMLLPGGGLHNFIEKFKARGNKADAAPASTAITWPPALDMTQLARMQPHPPRSIMEGVPCGYVSQTSAHGGTGKSQIELMRAVCFASGADFCGLPVERRRVLFCSCEDRADILHWRLSRICKHLEIDMASLAGWLQVLDLVGHSSILFAPDRRTGNVLTAAYRVLSDRMKEYGTEVLYLDGITDTFGGDENARAEVKQFINNLCAIIPPDRGAVILIGHISKSSASSGATSEGYSGSTAWHNSARARWFLHPEMVKDEETKKRVPTGTLFFDLQKSNHGTTGLRIEFQWDADAHMFTGSVGSDMDDFARGQRDNTERHGIMLALKGCATSTPPIICPAATTGQHTAYQVLSMRPEFPETIPAGKAGRTRFWRHIESLRQMNAIEEASYRRANRHLTPVFQLTTEGMRQCVE